MQEFKLFIIEEISLVYNVLDNNIIHIKRSGLSFFVYLCLDIINYFGFSSFCSPYSHHHQMGLLQKSPLYFG